MKNSTSIGIILVFALLSCWQIKTGVAEPFSWLNYLMIAVVVMLLIVKVVRLIVNR